MKDIDLLYENPNKLIEKYQDTIVYIINKFVQTGYIRYAYKDDFKQDVIEQLLLKIPKIKQSYNNKYQLSTYLSAIIRNICLEKLRKNQVLLQNLEGDINSVLVIHNSSIYDLAIEDEITRLETIFLLFNKQKEKLKLCLKVFFRMPVSENDIYHYLEGAQLSDTKIYVDFLNNGEALTNRDIFTILTKIINAKENKNNSADATRKWLNAKIDEIIFIMNGTPKRANYDKETFQILIENYFYKKEEKISIQSAKVNIDI
jgi:RNA polymerase sigma factor (sigma-70 family)